MALALAGPRGLTRDALGAGGLLLEQARVIVRTLEDLPGDVDPAIVAKAERTLIEEAKVHDAHALARLGEHILAVVAPEVGEKKDQERLERAARLAEQKRRLTMTRDGQGSVFLRATLPEAQAQMLTKVLHAIAAPKHQNATHGAGTWETSKPSAQRMGEAFCELIETLPTGDLPRIGRANASVVVTIDLEALFSGMGSATLDTGGVITAAEARRLACEARIIPAVLDGKSRVLDYGMGKRFHDEHQRGAITLEQHHCTATGCDWPAYLCHVHHDHPWSLGGPTDKANGRLLCPSHHARAHDPAYTATITGENAVSFTRINRRT